jgi:hypothetical protein
MCKLDREERLNPQEFADWLGRIYATREEELDCDQTQALLPAYADADFVKNDLDWILPDIEAHLSQCPDCAETYQGLKYVVEREAKGELLAAEGAMTSAMSPPSAASELTPA